MAVGAPEGPVAVQEGLDLVRPGRDCREALDRKPEHVALDEEGRAGLPTIGVDAKDLGTKIAREVINQCGGGKGSGEIAILEGEATAAYSLDMKNGAMEVFKTDASIKVVSSQPTS